MQDIILKQKSPESHHDWTLITIMAVVLAALITGMVVWILTQGMAEKRAAEQANEIEALQEQVNDLISDDTDNAEATVTIESEDTTENAADEEVDALEFQGLANKIVWAVEDESGAENIYIASSDGSLKKKLTSYAVDSGDVSNSIRDLQIIDNNYIGFFMCDATVGDLGCAIYRIRNDVQQVDAELVVQAEPTEMLEQIAWYGKDKVAYAVTTEEPKLKIIVHTGDGDNEIYEAGGSDYGRGGGIWDDSYLEFSPDGSKLLHISTSSVRDSGDFNIYVYNATSGAELAKIENATFPTWIDNTDILFSGASIDDGGNGLFIYDVDQKAAVDTLVDGIDCYNPQVLRGSDYALYFQEAPDQSGLESVRINLQTGESEKVGQVGMVLPSWITADEVLVESSGTLGEMGVILGSDKISRVNVETGVAQTVFTDEDFMVKNLQFAASQVRTASKYYSFETSIGY